MTINITIFVIAVAIVSSLLIVAPTTIIIQAQANQTNQTNQTKSIEGFNASNIRKAIDSETKTGHILQLHNASKEKQDQSAVKYYLFDCINYVVNPNAATTSTSLNYYLSLCDSKVMNMIVNHELGTNQTMIKAAYAYLKGRGIK